MDFLAISYTFRLAGDELRSQLSFTPEQKAGFEQQMIAAGLCRECLIHHRSCRRNLFHWQVNVTALFLTATIHRPVNSV